MSDAAQEFRIFLNAIAFSIILFVIFLRRSMKERERQRELASKWKTLNEKIKAARAILIMRQMAKKKRYQREFSSKWSRKLSKVQSVSFYEKVEPESILSAIAVGLQKYHFWFHQDTNFVEDLG